jgi:hypothetical protein
LCLHCCFAREVWWLVHTWTEGLIRIPESGVTVEDRWNSTLQAARAEDRGRVAAIIIYTATCGTKETAASSLVPHSRQQGYWVRSRRKWMLELRRRACEDQLVFSMYLFCNAVRVSLFLCNYKLCEIQPSASSYMIQQRSCLIFKKNWIT